MKLVDSFPGYSHEIISYIYIYIHINPQVMGLTANLTIEIRPSGKTLGSSGRSRGRCLATGPESERAREGLGGPCERI